MAASIFNGSAIKILKNILRFKDGTELSSTQAGYLNTITSDVQAQLNAKVDDTEKGAALGVATLDGSGKVPVSQLPSSVMEYKGTWNANTNTPILIDGTGDTGDVYLVSVAGTQDLGSGSITFAVGDFVIYSGSVWEKSGGVYANTSLSNLGVTSINEDLIMQPTKTLRMPNNTYITFRDPTDTLDVPVLNIDSAGTVYLNNDYGQVTVYAYTNHLNLEAYGATSDVNIAVDGSGRKFDIAADEMHYGGYNSQGTFKFVGFTDPTNYIGLKAPSTIGSQITLTLPTSHGPVNGVLQNDGTGILSFGNLVYDVSNIPSIDFDGRSLRDLNGDVAYSWAVLNELQLLPSGGTPKSISFYDGNFSNTLKITVPTNILSDYVITLPQNASGNVNSIIHEDGSGTLSFSTNLKDTSNVQSVLYASRELTDSTGSEVALNWNTRKLFDSNSDEVLDFSGTSETIISRNLVPFTDNSKTLGNAVLNYSSMWTKYIGSSTGLSLWADGNPLDMGSWSEQVQIYSYNGLIAPTLQLFDKSSFYIGLKSPDTLTGSYTLTLPADAGLSGQVPSTDGSGTLSWTTPAQSKKEPFTLSAGDVINGYVDLLNVAKTDSIQFVYSGSVSKESTDYTVSYTGGAGGKTRITFSAHTPTLVAGDVIDIQYMY